MFLCSPSLGIADNWMPVIWKLKNKRPDSTFLCLIPQARSVDEIDPSNVLFKLAAGVFDKVLFRSRAGTWLLADDFAEAKRLNRGSLFHAVITQALRKIGRAASAGLRGPLLDRARAWCGSLNIGAPAFPLEALRDIHGCLLFDVSETAKPYNAEVIANLRKIPKFSLCHGIDIWNGGIAPKDKDWRPVAGNGDVVAYLFSERERLYYAQRFGLTGASAKVVGVPRHSDEWMEFLLKSERACDTCFRDFILVVSRPGSTAYFPAERKRKALEDIKRLAWNDTGKKIVVKLHPKEARKEGAYESVFGKRSYGKKWVYSDIHPLTLGRNCFFAVTFYSGVAMDMIKIGAPAIERLDLRGIPGYDNGGSLRDGRGDPVLSIRYLGLVLGASDYAQMKEHVARIMRARDAVAAEMRDRYHALFGASDGADRKVAGEILAALKP